MKTAKELKNYKDKLKRHLTPSEKYVEFQLKQIGIDYKKQMILGFYILDFVLPYKLLCIEIDGGYHKQTYFKDQLREKFIKSAGFQVIRIKNEDVTSFDYNKLLDMPTFTEEEFRHVLGMGNAIKASKLRVIRKNIGQFCLPL